MASLNARRDTIYHKVQDGNNIFRVLPPFGESSNGYPYRKWAIIWGLLDPQSGRMRPYASPITSEEKKCPVFEFVQTLKKKAEEFKIQFASEGLQEGEIKERLASLYALINDLNPKTVYAYNVSDKAGKVGILELKSTAHREMRTKMSEYINDYNQDPTSLGSDSDDSGVWFNIQRSGKGRDTKYTVDKNQTRAKNERGQLVYEDDRSPLPDSVVTGFEKMAYDLSKIYQTKTYAELAEILEANMPAIMERCELLSDSTTPVKQSVPVSKPAARPATKVALKLDDPSDTDVDEEVAAAPAARPKASTSVQVQADDFDLLAEAEALLNS